MRRSQRIVRIVFGAALLVGMGRMALHAQTDPAETDSDLVEVAPLLPPGISDYNLELFGKLAYTWVMEDETRVVEIHGDFSTRMGHHKLSSRDAVVWFRNPTWQDRRYLDAEIFLWEDAEILQPGGTIETGPALLVTLRSFGKLVLNTDNRAEGDNTDGDLFQEGLKARRLLDVAPAEEVASSDTPVHRAPTFEELRLSRPKPPSKVTYSAEQTSYQRHGDQAIVVAIENVFVSQGSSAKSGEYVELRADAAVLYLKADELSDVVPGLIGSKQRPAAEPSGVKTKLDHAAAEVSPRDEPKLTDGTSTRPAVEQWVSAVYLEGDVMLTRGQRMIRASRLYYDFDNDRALILDVVTRALEPKRGLPIYIRADQVRQLDARTYSSSNAQITTSEFHTPHVAIGAAEMTFEDITPRDERGEIIGVQAGSYTAKHTTLNLDGLPLAYWPYSAGTFSEDRQAFRRAKIGYSGEFGGTLETEWYLFNLLGMEAPEGFDATLRLDGYTKRGPAIGIDMDYQRDDYYGLLRSYYIRDNDEDDLGPERGGKPDHEDRGRILWRHRQFLPKGWELSLETAYISDDQYLESYERNEFENAKAQETLLRLLKRQDNWQYSLTANWRINEFQTETERLPDNRFSLIAEPLGDYVTFYSDNRLGAVRYRPDERLRFSKSDSNGRDNFSRTGGVVRGDSRQEVHFLLPDLGPVKLTPFLMARGTAWDDSPGSIGRGGQQRGMVGYGLHGNLIASRVYDDVESDLFDLHRLRHVIKLDATGWGAHSTVRPDEVSPFDPGVEDIDDFGGATVGIRQRLQTRRGGPGQWRTVDWITLDVEAGFFHDAQDGEDTHGDFIFARPEDSISSSFLAANFQYRLSDSTVLVYDGVYDVNRGNVGTSNVSIAVEREPRLAYFAGWRYIHDTDSNLVTFGSNYKLNQKHTVAFRETYDIQEGRNFSTEVIYIRKWQRWYSAVTLDIDRTLDDIGINLSIWPEGAPRLGLGSRRYTGLADSVGLQLR
ncbi:MAG: LPS assembly protein LptD [Phycisphaerae bacterium]